ncbi:ABC transporter substrate-binding protein [Plantactinospora sp. GCM10030261]|uniref:ABC transporter substrate-binding protein n=1 Tax=Plantactinospora sp. GCM10030261 TaxID=3273420 RepID=UPI003623FE92
MSGVPRRAATWSRRQLLLGAGALAGGVVLGGCTTTRRSSDANVDGPLVIALDGEPPTLFQNLEYHQSGFTVGSAIMEYLVQADPLQPDAGQQPGLAVEWKPVGDRQWEFTLREGVRFHNGEEWDAEAAKFNIEQLFEIQPPSPILFRIQPFASAQVRDRYTLLINTKEPWAMCPVGLSQVQFAPPAHLQSVGPEKFAQEPIGTGPYQLAEWRKGEAIVLERFEDYWGDAPSVQRIEFRGIPDQATRLAALRSREVHLAEKIGLADLAGLRSDGFVVADTPEARSNLLSPYIAKAAKDGHPTADPRVRLAMNLAIDRRVIVDSVLEGMGQATEGQVIGRDAFGWNPDVKEYPHDPQRARELLAQAGHRDGVDLGALYRGEPSAGLMEADFTEVIRSQLAEVGIQITVQPMEQSTFLKRALQDIDLDYWQVGGWDYFPVMDAAFGLMWYDTEAFLGMDLNNPEYDKVFRASNREFDVTKRRDLLRECSRLVHEQAGSVTLWQNHKTYVHVPEVQGFRPTPDSRIHLDGISLGA